MASCSLASCYNTQYSTGRSRNSLHERGLMYAQPDVGDFTTYMPVGVDITEPAMTHKATCFEVKSSASSPAAGSGFGRPGSLHVLTSSGSAPEASCYNTRDSTARPRNPLHEGGTPAMENRCVRPGRWQRTVETKPTMATARSCLTSTTPTGREPEAVPGSPECSSFTASSFTASSFTSSYSSHFALTI